jgi:hypothetical protein
MVGLCVPSKDDYDIEALAITTTEEIIDEHSEMTEEL